jgi:hypothetical protein
MSPQGIKKLVDTTSYCFADLRNDQDSHPRSFFSLANNSPYMVTRIGVTVTKKNVVGGFKHFLFSIIYGIIIPID